MTRFRFGSAIPFLLLLGGCDWGSSVDLRNESGAVVAEQIRKVATGSDFAQPGRWETKITLNQVDAPGMPAAFTEKLKAQMRQPQTAASCLTAEDVKKGAFYVGEENKACRYERFAMGKGRIDGVLRCTDQMGTRSMAMSGSYGRDTYKLVVTTDSQSAQQAGAAGKVSVTMTMDARRSGQCLGTEGRPLTRL
ncbi:DUF3617 domain-containing protein [Sphingomonas sp. Sphisp140]|uniref:DUF3617 domain-containing protein n=1 Tax=unclassified Sphingomonas TaxID=196159 RepID=UPI0039AEAEC5